MQLQKELLRDQKQEEERYEKAESIENLSIW